MAGDNLTDVVIELHAGWQVPINAGSGYGSVPGTGVWGKGIGQAPTAAFWHLLGKHVPLGRSSATFKTSVLRLYSPKCLSAAQYAPLPLCCHQRLLRGRCAPCTSTEYREW